SQAAAAGDETRPETTNWELLTSRVRAQSSRNAIAHSAVSICELICLVFKTNLTWELQSIVGSGGRWALFGPEQFRTARNADPTRISSNRRTGDNPNERTNACSNGEANSYDGTSSGLQRENSQATNWLHQRR